jgi:hypothetical protein
MDKTYKSKSYDEFRNVGEDQQKPRKAGNTSMGKDPKGVMETPVEGFKQDSSLMKRTLDKMKYAPKTVSYSEFTKAKRDAHMQSMVSGSNKDESSKQSMEKFGGATLPKHSGGKSFDIDVTKYNPRKAKG